MKFDDRSYILIDRTARAAQVAFRDVLERRRGDAPRLTGEYASSLELRSHGNEATIGSPLPQAGAVERGANVGARRGPHMGPVGTLSRAGEDFLQAMPRALRTTR